ncbi:MAG TPA: hypothetical protein VI461_12365 [Chitinophagaceae bacterium]|nr:hypothetical protein [Chitinophagaceae bacterium]
MQPLYFIYMSCLLTSAIVAIIYRRNLINWQLNIMIFYLPLVFIMEVYQGWQLFAWGKSTASVYNIYKPVSVIVFGFIYYSIPIMVRFRKLIVGITAVYLIITITAYLTIDSVFSTNNTYLTLSRGICITFFCVFFLISIFVLDNPEKEMFWRPLIWITIGAVTFYPVVSISLGFHNFLRDYNATLFGLKLYQAIPQLMSIFMYSCFIYAFYLCKKKS